MDNTFLSHADHGLSGPSTFDRFMELPAELRICIWLLATPRETRFVLMDPGVTKPTEMLRQNHEGWAEKTQRRRRIGNRSLGAVTCFTPAHTADEPVSEEEGAAGSIGTWLVFPRRLRLPSTLHACHESLQVLTTYVAEGCSSSRYTRMPQYIRTPSWPHYIVEMRCPFISYDDDIFIKGRYQPVLFPQEEQLAPFWPLSAIDDTQTLQRKTDQVNRTISDLPVEAVGLENPASHHQTYNHDSSGEGSGCIHSPQWALGETEALGVFDQDRIRRLGMNAKNWVYRNLKANHSGGVCDTFPGIKDVAILEDDMVLVDHSFKVTWELDPVKMEWHYWLAERMIKENRDYVSSRILLDDDEEDEGNPEAVDFLVAEEAEAELHKRLYGQGHPGLEIVPYSVSGLRRYIKVNYSAFWRWH